MWKKILFVALCLLLIAGVATFENGLPLRSEDSRFVQFVFLGVAGALASRFSHLIVFGNGHGRVTR